MSIERTPDTAARRSYDLVVVGGGIYGAMVALEATLRDCSVLLLEKDDFGGATSYNSLRIIHGGLRDLRTLNLERYWTFGRERRWFLEHFPHLVERLPVLIPLYQRGIMRTEVFRLAFWADRLLLPGRDRWANGAHAVPPGRVLSPSAVARQFPAVDPEGLAGGALWYDARVPDSQRLLMEVLRAACRMGATALNYMPATRLLREQGRVKGVQAQDAGDGGTYHFRADTVVNAAGPWSREVAEHFDRGAPGLRPCLSAWNVLVDREAPGDCAVGKTPPESDHHYFLHPWKGHLLIGTGHAPRESASGSPRPSPSEMNDFLGDVNAAFPDFELRRCDVLRVYAGYLPTTQPGSTQLAKEEHWVDHGARGGPEGLFSVQGTKFTAAHSTAEAGMKQVVPGRSVSGEKRAAFEQICAGRNGERGRFGYTWTPDTASSDWRSSLARLIDEEAVVHLDDLLLRRTTLGDNPTRALAVAPALCDLFAWGAERRAAELRRVAQHFPRVQPPPSVTDAYA